MEIIRNQCGSITALELIGRLDLASGVTLKEKVKAEFDGGNTRIHLNMAKVDFVNSSGLGALVSVMKETRLRSGRLTLSNLASYVQEIFEITQLAHIFEIYPTQDVAISSYEPALTR